MNQGNVWVDEEALGFAVASDDITVNLLRDDLQVAVISVVFNLDGQHFALSLLDSMATPLSAETPARMRSDRLVDLLVPILEPRLVFLARSLVGVLSCLASVSTATTATSSLSSHIHGPFGYQAEEFSAVHSIMAPLMMRFLSDYEFLMRSSCSVTECPSVLQTAMHSSMMMMSSVMGDWDSEFIARCITAHCMCGCASVVIANECERVERMLATLAVFTPSTILRKAARLTVCRARRDFVPGLYLQGIVLQPGSSQLQQQQSAPIPAASRSGGPIAVAAVAVPAVAGNVSSSSGSGKLAETEIIESPFPVAVIYLDSKQVYRCRPAHEFLALRQAREMEAIVGWLSGSDARRSGAGGLTYGKSGKAESGSSSKAAEIAASLAFGSGGSGVGSGLSSSPSSAAAAASVTAAVHVNLGLLVPVKASSPEIEKFFRIACALPSHMRLMFAAESFRLLRRRAMRLVLAAGTIPDLTGDHDDEGTVGGDAMRHGDLRGGGGGLSGGIGGGIASETAFLSRLKADLGIDQRSEEDFLVLLGLAEELQPGTAEKIYGSVARVERLLESVLGFA